VSDPDDADLRTAEGTVGNAGGDSTPTKRLGDFELLQEIGRGGMGVVFEARQISLDRRVALKVLPPGIGLTRQATERFEREARAAAKLHHTNIVPVYAIGEDSGCHFYAMELIEGQSLSEVLYDLGDSGSSPLMDETLTLRGGSARSDSSSRSGTNQAAPNIATLSETGSGNRKRFDAVAGLISEVADALDYAHGRGVIHRDIKPSNLMLSGDGRLCITDFGLARMAQEPGITASGLLLGTPAYMSPEQVASGRVKLDHRTDVYSLGAVLYEMLTHRRPFPGESREQVLTAILSTDPKPPRRINPRIPLDLETICQKAMEKFPDQRYPTGGDMARDLQEYLHGGLISARRASVLRRSWKSIRRHPVAWTAATLTTLLVVVVGGVGGVLSAQRAEETARRVLADARLEMSSGIYGEALEKVDGVLEDFPELSSARVLRAQLLMKNNRVLDAVVEARRLLEEAPEDWTAHLILARAANSIHVQGLDADEHIRAVESMAPETAEAYFLRSFLAGSSSQAIELLNRALELNPADNEALVERINRHEALKDHPAALQDCERLIVARPRSSQGRRMKARIELARYDLKSAMREIDRAIELDPEDAKNFELRANIHRTAGRLDEALADRDRAIALAPDNAYYLRRRAEAHRRAARFEEAIVDARLALTINPEERTAYLVLLRANRSLGRTERVDEILDELREVSAGWAEEESRAWAHRELSAYERRYRRYDEALTDATRAIEIDPGGFRNYLARASVRQRSGDREGFRADCDAAARLPLDDPDDIRDRAEDLGRACSSWERALVEFERLIERTPNWHRAHFGLGTARYFVGNLEGAAAAFTRSIELAPNYPRAYNNRAAVYSSLHRYSEAMEDFQKAIALNPYDGLARSNLAETFELLGRLDEALSECDRAIEIDPLRWNAHAQRASVLAALSRCDPAMESFAQAVEHGGEKSQLHGELAGIHTDALIYFCADRYDASAALEHARKAADATPDDPLVASSLGAALLRNERYAEAQEQFERAVGAMGQAGARESLYLAMAAWRLGSHDAARQHHEQATRFMESRSVHRPALIQLRAETARLIGLEP